MAVKDDPLGQKAHEIMGDMAKHTEHATAPNAVPNTAPNTTLDTPEPRPAKTARARGTLALDDQCRATLRVLGYLFLRMGRIESARRTFSALSAALPKNVSPKERSWVERNLAATALEENDMNTALLHINNAMQGITMSTSDAALYLMKARALWRQGRQSEARQALTMYMHLAGAKA